MRYKILQQRAGYAIVDTATESILPGSHVWDRERAVIRCNQANGIPNDVVRPPRPRPPRRSAQRRAVAPQPSTGLYSRRNIAHSASRIVTVQVERERASGRYR